MTPTWHQDVSPTPAASPTVSPSASLPASPAATSTGTVTVTPDPQPADNDVVAGKGAFIIFALLIVAVVIIGRSLVTRLKNVDRAAEQGLYDPSDPKRDHGRPGGRGLNAPRPPSA